jgi:uncharacterized membrane protein YgdD (TMEM256/DUF423 family)
MNPSFWTLAGSVLGFFAVVLGAFGAHGIKNQITPESMQIYQTASQYQMFHALALVGLGAWLSAHPDFAQSKLSQFCGWGFILGTIVFSGSLYFLSVTGIRWLGAVTPIGGVLFLMSWLNFAWLAWRKQ